VVAVAADCLSSRSSQPPFPSTNWPNPGVDRFAHGKELAAAGTVPRPLAVADRLASWVGRDHRQRRRRLAGVFGPKDLAEILVILGRDIEGAGVLPMVRGPADELAGSMAGNCYG